MNLRTSYNTRQKRMLLEYLETVAGTHFTAADVCDYFRAQGKPIGQSTVYRHMDRLVEKGLVRKYIIDEGSAACFEYIGEAERETCGSCFHCKCEKCGKLIHLHCDELSGLREHILKEHGFKVNPLRTVFYGLCESCMED